MPKVIVVTGTTAPTLMWTPFGYHMAPGIPVTVTIEADENGVPLPNGVTNVVTGNQSGPIA